MYLTTDRGREMRVGPGTIFKVVWSATKPNQSEVVAILNKSGKVHHVADVSDYVDGRRLIQSLVDAIDCRQIVYDICVMYR